MRVATVAEVAQDLGVSAVSVYAAINSGRVPARRALGSTGPFRIFLDDSGQVVSPPGPSGRVRWAKPTEVATQLRVTARLVCSACVNGHIAARTLFRRWRVAVDAASGLPLRPDELERFRP